MLKIQKVILSGIAIAAFAAATSGQAAMAVSTPIDITGDNTPGFPVNWSGGVGGTLNVFVPNGFIKGKVTGALAPNVTIAFSPLVGIGAGGYIWMPAFGGFAQRLGGGNFTVTDNGTHALLFSGNFGAAVLHGTNGSSSASLTLEKDSVNFTGPINAFLPGGLAIAGGSLAIELNMQNPIAAAAGGAGPFMANDGISFKTK